MKKLNFTSGLFIGLIVGLLVGASGIAIADSPIKLIINSKEIACDVAPQIINGRTMVPARYVAENLGASVKWDSNLNAVVITSGDITNANTSTSASDYNKWLAETNAIAGRMDAINKEFTAISNDKSLIDVSRDANALCLRINPILQDALTIIPPANKQQANNFLIEYIKADAGMLNAYSYWMMNLYFGETSADKLMKAKTYQNETNYYAERKNSMRNAFLSNK